MGGVGRGPSAGASAGRARCVRARPRLGGRLVVLDAPRLCGVVEESVYVAASARGRGVGRALLDRLLAATDAGGIWTVQAGVQAENVASLMLHERAGFRRVGVRERLPRRTASGATWCCWSVAPTASADQAASLLLQLRSVRSAVSATFRRRHRSRRRVSTSPRRHSREDGRHARTDLSRAMTRNVDLVQAAR